MFYPRGYVIVSFKSKTDAEKVRSFLVDGGYDEYDVQVMDTQRVLEGTTEDLKQLSPLSPGVRAHHRVAVGLGSRTADRLTRA